MKCALLETNRHSNTRIEVVRDANETTGQIPDGLSKVVAPTLKKEIVLSVEAEVTGHLRDAAEEKWTVGDRIEVPCIYRFYGPKKRKAEFRNKLSKQINITDNKLAFIVSRCFFLYLDNKRDISRI